MLHSSHYWCILITVPMFLGKIVIFDDGAYTGCWHLDQFRKIKGLVRNLSRMGLSATKFIKPYLEIPPVYTRTEWWIHGLLNGWLSVIDLGTWQSLVARFMWPTLGPSGADRTQVGPMLATWTLLSGVMRLEGNITPFCIFRWIPELTITFKVNT